MIAKIISGGQTGADIAGLDFAISHGILHGGTCPLGRRSENGRIPDKYNLIEHPSFNYLPRTLENVKNSDATLIVTFKRELTGGCFRTAEFCKSHKKPYLHVYADMEATPTVLSDFINFHKVTILNVAGSRESKERGIYGFTNAVLKLILHLTTKEEIKEEPQQPTIHSF